MRAACSRQISYFSLYACSPTVPLVSLIHLVLFCSASTTEDHSLRVCHVSRKPTRPFYLFLLKASASRPIVFSVQAHAFKFGFQHSLIVSTTLLSSLVKFDEFRSARKLFDEMPSKDVAIWNAMLSGYVRNGFLFQGLLLFQLMVSSCTRPNSLTLSVLLQLCGNFDDRRLGRSVHGYACRCRELEDTFLSNCLIVYYNKYGDLDASQSVFEAMPSRDIVSYNAVISGHMMHGSSWSSLEVLWLLRKEGLQPDLVTLETALQACGRLGEAAAFDGELIHGLLIRLGFKMDLYAENCLLIMYCKCGMVVCGHSLFDTMQMKNAVSWNIIVDGYVHIHFPWKALNLFLRAHSFSAEVSSELLVSALQAVRLMGEQGDIVMSLHCLIIKMCFDSNIYIRSSVISAYGDIGDVEYARRCFNDTVPPEDNRTVCWNSMISVYLRHGYFSEAVELSGMEFFYDAVSLVNMLSLCVSELGLKTGKAVHGYAIRNRFESDIFVSTSLLDLYITYGCVHTACKIFSNMLCRNIVSWNTMITGCARLGLPAASLKLFHLMQQRDGFMPDATSLVGVIEAISHRGIEDEMRFIHEYAIKKGFFNDEFVATSLIYMHSKFHDFSKASTILDIASKLGNAIWNAMISQYSYHGLLDSAIFTFRTMTINGISPNSVTMLCLLQGCIASVSLNWIQVVHAIICRSGHDCDVFVGSTLINAYAKCGVLSMSWQVFNNMDSKTIVSWNSMIHAYGIHGKVEEAGSLFLQMQMSGLHPSAVTFLVLISSCSHVGDVEKGLYYLDLMLNAFSLQPRYEHLSSFIGLLGRSGLIQEAYELLENMPEDPGVCAWGALVGASQVEGNMRITLAAAQKLFEMYPLHQGYHKLLSNILADSGRWMDASLTRSKVDKVGHGRERAWSMVETLL